MGWFERNLPIMARLLPRRRGFVPGKAPEDSPIVPEEMPSGQDSAMATLRIGGAVGSSQPYKDPAQFGRSDDDSLVQEFVRSGSPSMSELYQNWVELGERINEAQSELQLILDSREGAEVARRRAQEVVARSRAIKREARQTGESAWRAFDQGFTSEVPGVSARRGSIWEINEAMKAQSDLQQSNYQEALLEADRTRHRATAELLKALHALKAADAHVDREVSEAAKLPALAESLVEAAQRELAGTRAIREELALLGQEALDQLDAGIIHRSPVQEPRAEIIFETPPESNVGESLTLAEPFEVDSSPVADVPSVAGTGAELHRPESPGPETTTPAVSEPISTEREEAPKPEIEPAGEPEEQIHSFPLGGAADELRREIDAARPAAEEPGSAAASVSEALKKELDAIRSQMGIPAPPASSAPAVPSASDLIRPPQPPANAQREPAVSASPPPRLPAPASGIYTGRVYLMFPGTLSQDNLESVWEILEDVTGVGIIVETRLVSREEGIQFTLELGTRELEVDSLRNRMHGADIVALGSDRLRIDWPRHG